MGRYRARSSKIYNYAGNSCFTSIVPRHNTKSFKQLKVALHVDFGVFVDLAAGLTEMAHFSLVDH